MGAAVLNTPWLKHVEEVIAYLDEMLPEEDGQDVDNQMFELGLQLAPGDDMDADGPKSKNQKVDSSSAMEVDEYAAAAEAANKQTIIDDIFGLLDADSDTEVDGNR